MAVVEQQNTFWLADWQVNPALDVIEKEGKTISLEPKVMAVLLALAEKPGEVLSRQQLEEQVWQGTVVGYDALAKAINKLREALGDDKKAPRYIQTISKKGYRLVAEVKLYPSEQPNQHEAGKQTPKSKASFKQTWFIAGGLATIIIVALIFSYSPSKLAGVTSVVQTSPVVDSKPTIVVLPFRNISPSDKDDYLADGLTSDLVTNLSNLSSLWVTASNANQAYKNTEISTDKIKQIFNARYVISGEVNKIGQAIRINVHLTDTSNGTILWAERYDRQFTDLFAIQDEVTQKILDNLSLTVTNEEKQRISKRYTNNLEAYETFLRAQFQLNARTGESNISARDLLKKAIELDPGFARAYSSMSYSYAMGYLRQWPTDAEKPLEKALQLARQAIALDKDLPEGYWSAALVYLYQSKINKGNELLEEALKLNPNYADAYALLATNFIAQGKPERTLESIATAYQLNPVGGYLYDMQVGRAHYFMNNYELAHKTFVAAFERNPSFIDLQMYMAATYVQLERFEEAGWMIYEAKKTHPEFDPHVWANAYPYLDNKGYREKLLNDIDKAIAYSRR